MGSRLAAVVITYNEERNIARCLESLKFCDEVIVVDSGSFDRTIEIAREYTSLVTLSSWRGYAAQKNYANSFTSADWILSIDADEEVSAELKEEILHVLSSHSNYVAFTLPRKTIHLGKWIRYGGWYPNRLLRLFMRSKGSWTEEELHERWAPVGQVGALQADLYHYSFVDLADQVARNNRYSSLGALKLQRSGETFSCPRLFLKSFHYFERLIL